MDKIDKRKKPKLRELSEEDKERLREKHTGLMVTAAERHISRCHVLRMEDLVQEAWFALVNAAERFDESRKIKFSSYAMTAMERRIRTHINVSEKELHTPTHVTVDRYKYREARKKLKGDNGEEPSLEEISEEAKVPIGRIRTVAEITKHPPVFLHIDQSDREEGPPLGKVIPDNQKKFKNVEDVEKSILIEKVLSVLRKRLTQKEKYVIRSLLGLSGHKHRTLKEMGTVLKLSKEGVRQIYNKAIRKLQEALNN